MLKGRLFQRLGACTGKVRSHFSVSEAHGTIS